MTSVIAHPPAHSILRAARLRNLSARGVTRAHEAVAKLFAFAELGRDGGAAVALRLELLVNAS